MSRSSADTVTKVRDFILPLREKAHADSELETLLSPTSLRSFNAVVTSRFSPTRNALAAESTAAITVVTITNLPPTN
jgi:hypothetical protein